VLVPNEYLEALLTAVRAAIGQFDRVGQHLVWNPEPGDETRLAAAIAPLLQNVPVHDDGGSPAPDVGP
jgi:hypothetical protein